MFLNIYILELDLKLNMFRTTIYSRLWDRVVTDKQTDINENIIAYDVDNNIYAVVDNAPMQLCNHSCMFSVLDNFGELQIYQTDHMLYGKTTVQESQEK